MIKIYIATLEKTSLNKKYSINYPYKINLKLNNSLPIRNNNNLKNLISRIFQIVDKNFQYLIVFTTSSPNISYFQRMCLFDYKTKLLRKSQRLFILFITQVIGIMRKEKRG